MNLTPSFFPGPSGEELREMDRENKAMRPGYDDKGVRELMAAICLQAAVDYKQASIGKRPGGRDSWKVMRECEHFFETNFFRDTVRVQNRKKIIEKILAIPDDFVDYIRKAHFESKGDKDG